MQIEIDNKNHKGKIKGTEEHLLIYQNANASNNLRNTSYCQEKWYQIHIMCCHELHVCIPKDKLAHTSHQKIKPKKNSTGVNKYLAHTIFYTSKEVFIRIKNK
tara:strand:- start:250 stop:558 length:309 start_codon:yes stop_codon:yes gene_type:complete